MGKNRFRLLAVLLTAAVALCAVTGILPRFAVGAAPSDYFVIDDCDANTYFRWQADTAEKMQGIASVRTGINAAGENLLNNAVNFAMDAPEGLANMYLEFWFFVGDPACLNATKTTVELFQSGSDAYTWNYKAVGTLKKGWNKILLPVASAALRGTVTRINQLRINLQAVKNNGVFRIDDLVLTSKPTAEDKSPLEAAVARGEELPSSVYQAASDELKGEFDAAMARARSLLNGASATQRDADQAARWLVDMINAFGFEGFTRDANSGYPYVDISRKIFCLTDGYGVTEGEKYVELDGRGAAGFSGSLLVSPAAGYVQGQRDLRFTLRYYDGEGGLKLHYTGDNGDTVALTVTFAGTGIWRNATVRVRDAALSGAFSGYDLKVEAADCTAYVDRIEVRQVDPEDPSESDPPVFAPQTEQNNIIGASSIGYQMWFAATDADRGWNAWSPGGRPLPIQGRLTFDGYPYMEDYKANGAVLYESGLGELGNGDKSLLFHSREEPIVETHFQWIAEYGIDCMAVQRFSVDYLKRYTEENNHLCLVRDMAEKYGKTFYVMYDVTGEGYKDSDTVFADITADVVYNIEGCGVSTSPVYAHAHGKPVICIWGIEGAKENYVRGYTASRVISWLKERGYFVIVGTGDNDYASREGEWLEPFTLADMISPWTVGRYNSTSNSIGWLRTHLAIDLEFCEKYGCEYQPVIFPGFSWTNMLHTGKPNAFPRIAGAFAWQQALQCTGAGAGSVYFAMFDEYNEGTAWMKGAADYFEIPKSQYFVTYAADGTWLSNDYYLRLAGRISDLFKGKAEAKKRPDIPHSRGPVYWRNSFERRWTNYLDEVPAEEEVVEVQHTALCNVDVCAPLSLLLDNRGVSLNLMEDQELPDYVTAEPTVSPDAYAAAREGTGIFRDVSGQYVRSGEWAFRLDVDASASNSRLSYILAGCDIMVSAAGLQLSYSLYAETDPGRTVYVDLFNENGVSLSGRAPALAQVKGTRGGWTTVKVDLPASLVGEHIRYIGVSWSGGAGRVKAVVDDVTLQSVGSARSMLQTAVSTASGLEQDMGLALARSQASAVLSNASSTDAQRLSAVRAIDDAIRAMGSGEEYLKGDVDGDGAVTSTDARLVLQLAVDKIDESDLTVPEAADADGDGSITSTDARLILQYAVEKITDWP